MQLDRKLVSVFWDRQNTYFGVSLSNPDGSVREDKTLEKYKNTVCAAFGIKPNMARACNGHSRLPSEKSEAYWWTIVGKQDLPKLVNIRMGDKLIRVPASEFFVEVEEKGKVKKLPNLKAEEFIAAEVSDGDEEEIPIEGEVEEVEEEGVLEIAVERKVYPSLTLDAPTDLVGAIKAQAQIVRDCYQLVCDVVDENRALRAEVRALIEKWGD